MKLKLKHLAPYLPYKLMLWHENNKSKYPLVVGNDTLSIRGGLRIDEFESEGCKPILRLLSDLTKQMDNQDKITWIDYLWFEVIGTDSDCFDRSEFEILVEYDTTLAPYKVIEYLFSQHFDVFGLIEQGIAIDINTLNK